MEEFLKLVDAIAKVETIKSAAFSNRDSLGSHDEWATIQNKLAVRALQLGREIAFTAEPVPDAKTQELANSMLKNLGIKDLSELAKADSKKLREVMKGMMAGKRKRK